MLVLILHFHGANCISIKKKIRNNKVSHLQTCHICHSEVKCLTWFKLFILKSLLSFQFIQLFKRFLFYNEMIPFLPIPLTYFLCAPKKKKNYELLKH